MAEANPAEAKNRKIRERPQEGTDCAKKEASMVPRIMPRNETVSICPAPSAICPVPPISRMSPYLEGENRLLWVPISKMAIITIQTCSNRNPAEARSMIGISANLAILTTLILLNITDHLPARGERNTYGTTSDPAATETRGASYSAPTQVTATKHASVFRKLSFRTPRKFVDSKGHHRGCAVILQCF